MSKMLVVISADRISVTNDGFAIHHPEGVQYVPCGSNIEVSNVKRLKIGDEETNAFATDAMHTVAKQNHEIQMLKTQIEELQIENGKIIDTILTALPFLYGTYDEVIEARRILHGLCPDYDAKAQYEAMKREEFE